MRLFYLIKAAVFAVLLCAPVVAQQTTAPEFQHVTITLTTDASSCGCIDPTNYSVSLDENGTVIYNGGPGSKVRGEKIHSISVGAVRDLVADIFRINFFSFQDRYQYKQLPNGNREGIDHSYAYTIAIDIDGKKKTVYIFYGAPDELIAFRRKIFDLTEIAQYVGRA
jgi:hypothetical protein